MSLIITFMFEPAKLQMNWARASGAMNARGEPTQLAVAEPGSGVVALTSALKPEAASVSDHHPNWMSRPAGPTAGVDDPPTDQLWLR
jgi:hypothetical protein